MARLQYVGTQLGRNDSVGHRVNQLENLMDERPRCADDQPCPHVMAGAVDAFLAMRIQQANATVST